MEILGKFPIASYITRSEGKPTTISSIFFLVNMDGIDSLCSLRPLQSCKSSNRMKGQKMDTSEKGTDPNNHSKNISRSKPQVYPWIDHINVNQV